MRKYFILPLVFVFMLLSCSDEQSDKVLFSVLLTDSPAEYEEVLIDIQDVKINPSGINDNEGWISLENVNTGVYNLLHFTNGLDTLLADMMLTPGLITQIRLVLGNNNRIKKEGTYYDLKTPSGQQSGLKLNIHAELLADINYKIWIDFDASRSIIKKGNGDYSLKPVIRAYSEATGGTIKGMIEPIEAKPYIIAVSTDNDTIGTFADTTSGNFMIAGLAEGPYTVELFPVAGFQTMLIENVNVAKGEVNDLGTLIILED